MKNDIKFLKKYNNVDYKLLLTNTTTLQQKNNQQTLIDYKR